MRQLSEIELKQVRHAISAKGLNAAEILLEVYDHYVSHLQEFEAADFESELNALEERFTYGYCHALQANLHKSLNTEISRTQWDIVRSYFCFSRLIYSLGLLFILMTVSMNLKSDEQYLIMVYVPLSLLVGFSLFVLLKWHKNLKIAKDIFIEQKDSIKSVTTEIMMLRIILPVLSLNAIIMIPKTFLAAHDLSFALLPQISLVLTMALLLYGISLFEVWKIKSKSLPA
jgi:hypothetical protein